MHTFKLDLDGSGSRGGRRSRVEDVRCLRMEDVHNSVVVDERSRDLYFIEHSLMQGACIYRGRQGGAWRRPAGLALTLLGYFCPALMAVVWVALVEAACSEVGGGGPRLPRPAVAAYLALTAAAAAHRVRTWCAPGSGGVASWGRLRHLPLASLAGFMLLFPAYASYVAWVYARSCHVIQYERSTRLGAGSGNAADAPFLLSCQLRICWFAFCTKSSRVLLSMVAHMLPVVFALNCHLAISSEVPAVQFQAQIIDMLDIQDFSLLLIEDDIVRNFWDRDACDASGCAPNRRRLWKFVLASLWTACACVTLLTVVKVSRAIARVDEWQDARETMSAGFARQLLSKRPPGQCWVVVSSLLSLACVELPFLCVRLICTDRYGTAASTMILKNLGNVFLNTMRVLYRGDVMRMLRVYPSLGGFVEFGEDLMGVAPAQATGDCEAMMSMISPVNSPRTFTPASRNRQSGHEEEAEEKDVVLGTEEGGAREPEGYAVSTTNTTFSWETQPSESSAALQGG